MKNIKLRIISIFAALSMLLSSCGSLIGENDGESNDGIQQEELDDSYNTDDDETQSESVTTVTDTFSYSSVPDFECTAYYIVNDNIPYFTENELTTTVFEKYGDLDELGRCTTAYANICQELMPTESREDISEVYPTGWEQQYYDFVDGNYIYNRCHLIGFQLAGENANEKNLITGTRYMNVEGMLPFEDEVADYVHETNNHVLYRVTPVFEDDELVARGVLMEAYSIEDDGEGVEFCVFCYNVQPGITISYTTGENHLEGTVSYSFEPNTDDESETATTADGNDESETVSADDDVTSYYVLNTNTMKFHNPDCESVGQILKSNYAESTETRDELIADGYSPCGNCKP